jgi:hypothetical protein
MNIIILKCQMLSVVMLGVFMLTVFMQSVVMLSVLTSIIWRNLYLNCNCTL